jgi:hypothetical protein
MKALDRYRSALAVASKLQPKLLGDEINGKKEILGIVDGNGNIQLPRRPITFSEALQIATWVLTLDNDDAPIKAEAPALSEPPVS